MSTDRSFCELDIDENKSLVVKSVRGLSRPGTNRSSAMANPNQHPDGRLERGVPARGRFARHAGPTGGQRSGESDPGNLVLGAGLADRAIHRFTTSANRFRKPMGELVARAGSGLGAATTRRQRRLSRPHDQLPLLQLAGQRQTGDANLPLDLDRAEIHRLSDAAEPGATL